jgi:hypothetical protein
MVRAAAFVPSGWDVVTRVVAHDTSDIRGGNAGNPSIGVDSGGSVVVVQPGWGSVGSVVVWTAPELTLRHVVVSGQSMTAPFPGSGDLLHVEAPSAGLAETRKLVRSVAAQNVVVGQEMLDTGL